MSGQKREELRDGIALTLASQMQRRWDAEQQIYRSHAAAYGEVRAILDRYADAVAAPLHERIAALEAENARLAAALAEAVVLLRANVWKSAETVDWLGLCDHDVGECHCDIRRAMDDGCAFLAAYEEQR